MKYFFLFLSFLLLTAACSGEKYGSDIGSQAPLIKVKDVYLNKSLQGKVVNIEGEIISQCQSPDKCWCFIKDETGRVFVNFKTADFIMPAAIGKQAKITGTIQSIEDQLLINATGAEVF